MDTSHMGTILFADRIGVKVAASSVDTVKAILT